MADSNTPEKDIDDIFAAAAEPPEPGAVSSDFSMELDTDDIDLFDPRPEAEMRQRYEETQGITAPPKPERVEAPLHNPAMSADPTAELRDQVEKAFSENLPKITVTVSQEERERFVRAALHDTEMYFDVELPAIGVTIKVAIPPESFTAAAFQIAAEWQKAGVISSDSNVQFLLTYQQLHVWRQVRSVNGIPTSWGMMFEENPPGVADTIRIASDPKNLDEIRNMGGPRWRMLMEAARIAEIRYKLCIESWHDRSFFTTAGAV